MNENPSDSSIRAPRPWSRGGTEDPASDEHHPRSSPSILTVCTGNICRSVYAHYRLAHLLAGHEVEVRSAGMAAVVGASPTAEIIRLFEANDVRGFAAHRAQQLTPTLVCDADVVIAMSREHRSAVVQLVPRAVRKTFTLREIAHLLPHIEVGESAGATAAGQVRSLPQQLIAARSRVAALSQADQYDIEDPYLRPWASYERMAQVMDPAIEALAGCVIPQTAKAVGRALR